MDTVTNCVFLYINERIIIYVHFFFFNDTATTEIYTLSLHDALPICILHAAGLVRDSFILKKKQADLMTVLAPKVSGTVKDRKSTRLNSSHANISYAVFCLKKKKNTLYLKIIHLLSTVDIQSLSSF